MQRAAGRVGFPIWEAASCYGWFSCNRGHTTPCALIVCPPAGAVLAQELLLSVSWSHLSDLAANFVSAPYQKSSSTCNQLSRLCASLFLALLSQLWHL